MGKSARKNVHRIKLTKKEKDNFAIRRWFSCSTCYYFADRGTGWQEGNQDNLKGHMGTGHCIYNKPTAQLTGEGQKLEARTPYPIVSAHSYCKDYLFLPFMRANTLHTLGEKGNPISFQDTFLRRLGAKFLSFILRPRTLIAGGILQTLRSILEVLSR